MEHEWEVVLSDEHEYMSHKNWIRIQKFYLGTQQAYTNLQLSFSVMKESEHTTDNCCNELPR